MTTNSPNSPMMSPEKSESTIAKQLRNFLIAMAAIALVASLFFGTRVQTDTATLTLSLIHI